MRQSDGSHGLACHGASGLSCRVTTPPGTAHDSLSPSGLICDVGIVTVPRLTGLLGGVSDRTNIKYLMLRNKHLGAN